MERKNQWLEYKFDLNGIESDLLVALLADLPFNSFMEEEGYLLAYIEQKELDDAVENELHAIAGEYGTPFEVTEMEDRDWNEEWESNFQPVFIEDICTIVAPFHKDVAIRGMKIMLSPKMAFGTGHHYTTYGMIKAMSTIPVTGAKVLDFGSGTGLLAIFASMKGAYSIDAIDIEPPSYDNMQENFSLNSTGNIHPVLGGKEAIDKTGNYDLILANITANVITDSLDELSAALKPGGLILFSGFFEKDLEATREAAVIKKLQYTGHHINGGWVVATFEKSAD